MWIRVFRGSSGLLVAHRGAAGTLASRFLAGRGRSSNETARAGLVVPGSGLMESVVIFAGGQAVLPSAAAGPESSPTPASAGCRSVSSFVEGGELELSVLVLALDLDVDPVLALERAAEELLGQGVLDQVLDGATERPGAVIGVVALGDQEVLGLVVHDQLQAAIAHAAADLGELDVDDRLECPC